MRKHKLKTSVCAIASASLLLLSATAFNAAAEEEEEVANNLSVPAIFAEGYGMTGLPAYEKSGLPGSSTPSWGTPYCYQSNLKYFLQATDSLWQAEWSADALLETDPQPVSVTVDWGDEIVNQQWNVKSVIPVRVVLYEVLGSLMTGYNMYALPADICPCDVPDCNVVADPSDVVIASEEEVDEVWGTMKNDTYTSGPSDPPTVYTVCARLTINKITFDEYGAVVLGEELFSSAVYDGFGVRSKPDWYSAEINAEGELIYLYNWNIAREEMGSDTDKSGWYRLTFSLDPLASYVITRGKLVIEDFSVETGNPVPCNVSLDSSDESDSDVIYKPLLVTTSSSHVDIKIEAMAEGE